jgi:hypothetical protein
MLRKNLLYTYFNRKQRLHVNPQVLEILTLIREKVKQIITHHCHYNLYYQKYHMKHFISTY